jgi:hypothetical protein
LVRVRADEVVDECRRILSCSDSEAEVPEGEFWRLCFDQKTLRDICKLRMALLRQTLTAAQVALRALLLGCLHGPLTKGNPSYFSNQMPRTYASKPNSAVKFWKTRKLKPPQTSVTDVVTKKAPWYFDAQLPSVDGRIVCADSRLIGSKLTLPPISWIVTSPPYYGMRTYVTDQWLRHWFLGGPPAVEYQADSQLCHASSDEFTLQLASTWQQLIKFCKPNARLIVRFGGISDRNVDPHKLMRFKRPLQRAIEERDYFASLNSA